MKIRLIAIATITAAALAVGAVQAHNKLPDGMHIVAGARIGSVIQTPEASAPADPAADAQATAPTAETAPETATTTPTSQPTAPAPKPAAEPTAQAEDAPEAAAPAAQVVPPTMSNLTVASSGGVCVYEDGPIPQRYVPVNDGGPIKFRECGQ